MKNSEPLTWACKCGLINLLTDSVCMQCHESKDDYWMDSDRRRYFSLRVYDVNTKNSSEQMHCLPIGHHINPVLLPLVSYYKDN